ncbi:hypothetical protein Pan258_14640 [Symmachiella dynata]|nr:hypothetical protein Pan258_14640 [Symmachiella dynata]
MVVVSPHQFVKRSISTLVVNSVGFVPCGNFSQGRFLESSEMRISVGSSGARCVLVFWGDPQRSHHGPVHRKSDIPMPHRPRPAAPFSTAKAASSLHMRECVQKFQGPLSTRNHSLKPGGSNSSCRVGKRDSIRGGNCKAIHTPLRDKQLPCHVEAHCGPCVASHLMGMAYGEISALAIKQARYKPEAPPPIGHAGQMKSPS